MFVWLHRYSLQLNGTIRKTNIRYMYWWSRNEPGFIIERNKLKSNSIKHQETSNTHGWISFLYSGNLVDANTRICRLSVYCFPSFQAYTIAEITDYITPLSVVSALKKAVQSEYLIRREETVTLCMALKTCGETVNEEKGSVEQETDGKKVEISQNTSSVTEPRRRSWFRRIFCRKGSLSNTTMNTRYS